jgi:glycosyltransferase involved in cell wall biosynthesis
MTATLVHNGAPEETERMDPLVSVIIPSRSRPTMLREAVESVIAQTYHPIEIVIVLTGANAETTASARSLQEEYGARIVVTPPYNLATSRNNGMRAAAGEWITFLDDDDIYAPTKIQRQVETAELTGARVITNSWTQFNEFGPIGNWTPHPDKHLPPGLSYAEALTTGNFVSNGLLVRAEIMRELGGFDEKLDACEDWDMWRRISHHHELIYLDEPLVHIRAHSTNMSSRRWLMMSTAFRHLAKMHFDTPDSLRYMLPRARSDTLNRLFKYLPNEIYESLNRKSGGRIRTWVRAIKRHLSDSAKPR